MISLYMQPDLTLVMQGRIRKDTRGFYLSREIEVEGLLACLNDSIIPPYNFPDDFLDDANYQTAVNHGNVIEYFLDWLLEQHNSQVGDTQKIQLGNVTVTDPNNYISRASSDYSTTMDVVRKKLVDMLGGYLLVDYSGDTTILHYYDDLPLTNVQEVEYGENLLDLVSELDSAETYTAILPIGKEGLTIADLADGEISPGIIKSGKIIYSESAETACGGRITKPVKWDDVTQADHLRTKAVAKLTGEGVMTSQSITVKAVDLGGYNKNAGSGDTSSRAFAGEAKVGEAIAGVTDDSYGNLSRFMVGRYVRLKSAPHGFSAMFPLMELDPDIMDPGNTEITMGALVKSASDIAHSNQSSTEDKLDQQQMELDQQKSSITELTQSVTEQVTSAIQTCESIIFSALKSYVKTSNFEEYKETVSSQLAILADEISINLTQTTEQIEEVNGDLQSKYESITKYFRFTENGLYIGESGNEVLLRLDNDIVQFLRANVPALYMDEKGAHAEELHAETVHIGNYVLQKEDDGKLTLRKAVTA